MISSNRIILKSLLESDVSKDYLDTLNDSAYMRFSRNSNFFHTLNSQVQYIASFTLSGNLLFGIKSLEDQELLGTINCYINFSERTLDLGFLIFKVHHGRGYASEALGLFIPYLENQFPGMTAVIGTHKENFAMHEVARRLDFQIESDTSQIPGINIRFTRKLPKLNPTSPQIIPDFIINAINIGIAAHDAGGAEQITWLLRNLPQKVHAYIDGPAKHIFESSGLSVARVDSLSEIMNCDLIISGSGWMSELELSAIKEARLRNVPCLILLDHWVNYLERFGVDEKCQPLILAVTNSVALEIAQEKFPDVVVWLLPDFQIANYQERIKKIEKTPNCILILLEPVSSLSSSFAISKEIITKLINSAISLKRIRGLGKVVIRLHPAQLHAGWLMGILDQFSGEIELSRSTALIEDLEISDVVFGLSSYALYIAAMCGVETYSYFGGLDGHWTNRFPNILTLPKPS